MRVYIKGLLLLVYLLSFHAYYLERLEAMGLGVALVLYAGVFVLLVAALWLCANIRQGLVRWLFAVGFCASAVFFDAYTRITAEYLTYSAFVSMVYSGGFIGEALEQYHSVIVGVAAKGLLLLLGLGLRRTRCSGCPAPWRGPHRCWAWRC